MASHFTRPTLHYTDFLLIKNYYIEMYATLQELPQEEWSNAY